MRLDEYDFRGLPPDLIEWLQDCTSIINLGEYQMKQMASPPTSSTPAQNASFGVAKDGSTWYLYIYTNATDGWQKVALSAI